MKFTIEFNAPDEFEFEPPYLMYIFLPGREHWHAYAWSGEEAAGALLAELDERSPRLREAFVAFSEEMRKIDPEPHLRLVVPPRDQEPPEPLF